MARLYSNENVPLPVVQELRALGHDVLTSHEAGNAGQGVADEAVLALACDEGRVLLTLNRRHFVRLHHERPQHPGIVVCTFDPDFRGLAQRIHGALMSRTTAARELVRVNRPR